MEKLLFSSEFHDDIFEDPQNYITSDDSAYEKEEFKHCNLNQTGGFVCNITFYNYDSMSIIKRTVKMFKNILNMTYKEELSCVCVVIKHRTDYKHINDFISFCLSRGTSDNFAVIQLFDLNNMNSSIYEDYATYGHLFDYYKFIYSTKYYNPIKEIKL